MSHRILRYSTSYLLINMSLRVATASAMSLTPHVLIHITSGSESYNGYYVTVRRRSVAQRAGSRSSSPGDAVESARRDVQIALDDYQQR